MVGQNGDMREQVLRLARLAKSTGLDGVVCSPHEISAVREACGPDCLIVTPGIRPAGSQRGDQRRLTTPMEAIQAGADILVIGRPITGASDPAAAARAIAAEILASDPA
jgi:orotidine-5'-phosphate decarboxylase